MAWETVIGLEVHAQLLTRTKMFCACENRFGAEPNTLVCPVCLGLPGALPVPNARAIGLATQAALALGCTVRERSIFARKNYFYPDLPKGYQISQYDQPLATHGEVRFDSPERGRIGVGITRLHVEEDAGKSLHDRFPGQTAIDLNRAGTPLAEIVSEPDLRSPGEARAYLVALKQILVYSAVSDCNMEEGSLRVDANISIRPAGSSTLGTKTEVKNMNSFANVERALEVERERQIALVESGGTVAQMTMLFNATTGQVRPMRSKEESHDYRYFPDPDLPPLVLTPAFVVSQRAALPELPDAKRERLMAAYALTAYDAKELSAERPLAEYFEAVVGAGAEPKAAATWLMGEVRSAWNESGRFALGPDRLTALIGVVRDGLVSRQAAKKVFTEMLTSDEAPARLAERLGLLQVGDTDALAGWVEEVVTANPSEVQRYKGGETKLIGFFVGQIMKKSQGKADPKKVQPVLLERLKR